MVVFVFCALEMACNVHGDESSYQIAKLTVPNWTGISLLIHHFSLTCSSGSPCFSGRASRGRSMKMMTKQERSDLLRHYEPATSIVLFIIPCMHYVRQYSCAKESSLISLLFISYPTKCYCNN